MYQNASKDATGRSMSLDARKLNILSEIVTNVLEKPSAKGKTKMDECL